MLRESLGRMRVVFFGVFFCCFARVCTAVVQSRRCWWEAWRLARALAVALLHGTRTMTRGAPCGCGCGRVHLFGSRYSRSGCIHIPSCLVTQTSSVQHLVEQL